MRALLCALLFCATLPARAECLPDAVGGYGRTLTITKMAQGVVYTWWCPGDAEGPKGWTAHYVAVATAPPWPAERSERLNELARLRDAYGPTETAPQRNALLWREAMDIAESTRPRVKATP